MVDLETAAAYLGRNIDEVRKLAKKGIIPATQDRGRSWWFDLEELENWRNQNPKQSHKLQWTKDETIQVVGDRDYTEVAKEFNVSDSAIAHKMRQFGIFRRKR